MNFITCFLKSTQKKTHKFKLAIERLVKGNEFRWIAAMMNYVSHSQYVTGVMKCLKSWFSCWHQITNGLEFIHLRLFSKSRDNLAPFFLCAIIIICIIYVTHAEFSNWQHFKRFSKLISALIVFLSLFIGEENFMKN